MRSIMTCLTRNSFFILYIPFLLLGTLLAIFVDKQTLHLYQNQFNSSFFDDFFLLATKMGEGTFIVIAIAVVLIFNYRHAIIVGLGVVLSSINVWLLKNFVFNYLDRPSRYFSGNETFHFVENLHLHASKSFPSGHTAAAFAIFASIALLRNSSKLLGLFLFILAFIAGYSRVYLSQHFWMDVVAGSFVGSLWAFLVFYIGSRLFRI